ncbi:transcriptional regulator, TetR family [Streptoalloteichus hindustanus]|uniref:Transcriptional regulator, TetR family n=1 Tax=Streptoalloteichus hindustanus TaxID=2017 RepID=A0A1M5G865_STRHI|nr:transcriptional regulator, TetR family [Streptoalloteichus hindustanus]
MHSDDQILDAARDLLVAHGAAAATTGAISERSGAPVGSIYHHFGSRTALLARLWTRTVQRFQEDLLSATAAAPPGIPRAVAAAASSVDFALTRPADARLLLLARRDDLLGSDEVPPGTKATLATLNTPVTALISQLATEIYGSSSPDHLELVTLAVVDLPYAVIRRHLLADNLTPAHQTLVTTTTRTLLRSR